MPNMIQQGSYDSAKGMSSYIPFKYTVKNLRTDYYDTYGMRTNQKYEKAVIFKNPEIVFANYQKMVSNKQRGITNEDILNGAKNGLIDALLSQMPGESLIKDELCPKDSAATKRYDFESIYWFLFNVDKALKAKGASLSDVVLIIEGPFFGVDFRKTEYGRKNPGFLDDRYPNHHHLTRVTVAPRRENYKGSHISFFYTDILNPQNAKAKEGKTGVLLNNYLEVYDGNVKKKKTVKNVKLEFQNLEEIRKLGGAASIHDGNFKGKEKELFRLIKKLEVRDLANNDTVTGFTGLQDGLIHDLSLVHQVLMDVIKKSDADKVHVDFFEPIRGTNGRHFISEAFVYDKNGYRGVTTDYIKEMIEE